VYLDDNVITLDILSIDVDAMFLVANVKTDKLVPVSSHDENNNQLFK